MVVLSRGAYTTLKAALLDVISAGSALTHQHLEERFSELDFNMVQSLYSQLLVRESKKRRCPDLRTALASSSSSSAVAVAGASVSAVAATTATLRSIAVSSGVTPYKLARTYLTEVALVEFADFLNNPCIISDETVRFGIFAYLLSLSLYLSIYLSKRDNNF